jgi:MFS family permease
VKAGAQGEARRVAFVLSAAQAVLGSAGPICFALGALAGHLMLGPDKSLATAPLTGYSVGLAVGALPAAWVIRKLGHRDGFLSGAGISAIGGLIAAIALFHMSFWGFTFGLSIVGFGNAFVQQFRFAAADSAPPEFKARAISLVLAGGIITAVLGPQTVIYTHDLLAPVPFAGSFVAIAVLAVVGGAILFLLPARSAVKAHEAVKDAGRPLLQIVMQPRYAVALVCAVGSYSMMTFVMTGAPLAMVGCGFSSDEATLGISWHVMAMFGPSFFTGRLIHRFGAPAVVTCGFALLVGCSAVALSGIALWQFWTALILLGLGWNFAFIGATSMVAAAYHPEEKGRAQGFHDFVLFSTVAFASLMSGAVYNAWGWEMLAAIVLPVTGLCLLLLGAQRLADARKPS